MSESNTSLNNADDLPDPVSRKNREKTCQDLIMTFLTLPSFFFKDMKSAYLSRKEKKCQKQFFGEKRIQIPSICIFSDFTEIRHILSKFCLFLILMFRKVSQEDKSINLLIFKNNLRKEIFFFSFFQK